MAKHILAVLEIQVMFYKMVESSSHVLGTFEPESSDRRDQTCPTQRGEQLDQNIRLRGTTRIK